ncbi:MAG: hypothetical protein IPO32_05420 [Crocinitomicaceae bacterium]|nr:hypothetical protein [Crocinitomicaceae bacterium]
MGAKEKRRGLFEIKDFEFIWLLIKKNFLILIFVPILAYIIGYVYVYRLPEVYGAKVQLMLKSNETYDYQDPIYKGLGAYGLYTDVSNQTRILQSNDIVGEVVDKMNVNVSYSVIGRLKKKEVFGTLPFNASVEVINEGLYEVPILVKVLNENEYELTYEMNAVGKSFRYNFQEELITEDFKLKLARNYDFNESNIGGVKAPDYELLFHSKPYLISYFQNNMTITNIEFTSILEVIVHDNIGIQAKVF